MNRKNMTKEKKKSTNGSKKRGHSSTPTNSDDSEKHQTDIQSVFEKRGDHVQVKGHGKHRSNRKNRKCKTAETVEEDIPAPASEGRAMDQESLRWEGALNDPVAEAERLEIYRANRRNRYLSSQQALLAKTNSAIVLE